jgi:hypothetical protein
MRMIWTFVLGLTIAAFLGATATPVLAAPAWEGCMEVTKGGFENSECTKEKSEGKFEWVEITGTVKLSAAFTLHLADTKVPSVGTVEVQCSGTGSGSAGPGSFARIEKLTVSSCAAGEHCEKFEKSEPVNLPWKMELYETEGLGRDKITNGKKGKEAPGWEVTCKVLGVVTADRCTTEAQTVLMDDIAGGPVESLFDEQSGNAECSVGGAGSGRVKGAILIKANQVGVPIVYYANDLSFGMVTFGNFRTITDAFTIRDFEQTYGVPRVFPPVFTLPGGESKPCRSSTRMPVAGEFCEVEVRYKPAGAGEKAEGLLTIPFEKTVAPKTKYEALLRLKGES